MPTRLELLDDRLTAVLTRPLVLIAGAPHSGYDSVRLMLDAHPEMRCAPDGHYTDRFAVGLKDVLGDYNAGLEGGAAAFTQGDFLYLVRTGVALSLAKLEPGPDIRLLGCAVAVHARNLDFWELLAPDVKLLHIVRDGRAAAADALDPPAEPDNDKWLGALDAATYAWTDATRTACAFGASRPERYHELRWEDLQANSRPHLEAALRFLELRTDGAALDACLARRPAPAEPRVRLYGAALERVERQQGPLLRQFGYTS